MKKILLAFALVLLTASAGKKPVTLFMVGDSTMADKTELDISPEVGWGQVFPTFLNDKIVVQNHAMNGRSTKSFQVEGRWQVVLDRMSKGDIVILEFGHNDQKITDPVRYASVPDYMENLRKMTREAQAKGATVIIATPISRRHFDSKTGELIPKHTSYPYAARMVAKEMNVAMLDLEEATTEWLIGLGDEASKQYFMNVAPGECKKFPDGKIDNTHLRENGALVVGKMAAQMILDQKIQPLNKYINKAAVESAEMPKAIYTTFCRPNFKSDKTVKVESDLKSDIK
ncbi:MAG: rhamnogalacturonan acetylesterase [Bacteroidales bacterium]|jgi:lysophospholipase L1-like esterase|nr:rhamnogalacturonan acetylesterase [Bacteroidales bacterium]MBQ3913986.1 rhamnogalacturonan acetylesterase [Paludibacteraceae bacterium]MBR4460706.1 rhamnogalacturonan acetylesterase [Paludibacteraceae bacterium]MBR4546803.1 rhamnogalacturonan acetylesterase [Paludibacteraceae bacterium]MBR6145573.1 rhamnogalacturonan acetylesterase [Paludibacteraceae bacterium]